MAEAITVIYIISDRRSGSTLLENMLSKSSEVVSIGELAMLKGHVFKEGPGELWNWNCSCGKLVLNCAFWSKVLENINTDFETKIKWNFIALQNVTASFLPFVTAKQLLRYIHTKKNIQTTKTINDIYNKVSKVSSRQFIVDSSKDPIQALAVNECKNIHAKFILLTRDLRAVTFSKLKRWKVNKRSNKGKYETLLDSYLFKKLCMATLDYFDEKNTLKLRYEDVVAAPQNVLDKICTQFALKPYAAPQFMELSEDHTIAGTPDRFNRKPIAENNTWREFFKKEKLLNALGKVFNSL